ncbi:MAG: hypothetical protein V2A70_07230 [Candidatus Omnitrophota bacterium]
MHQLILGTDIALRDKILHSLKIRFLKTPAALKLDFMQIDGHGLEFNELKAALLTVPAMASKRLLVIARAEKLDERNLELIEHVAADAASCCVMLLEASSWDRRSAIRKRLAEIFQVSGGGESVKVFDILQDLSHDRAGVLVRLHKLLENDAVENVLGAIRWWWANKVKGSVPAVRYKKGLLVIQEADERNKLSGMLLKEQALEVVLVKLSLLLRA